MDFTHVGNLNDLQSHSRYTITLRSKADASAYKSLILFRLAAAEDGHEQLYAMESACPHLGADMSHADIEDFGDDEHGSLVAVCPWHRYDFDLTTGHSETGLRACVFAVELRPSATEDPTSRSVWIESPEPAAGGWELVERRPVSEEFAVTNGQNGQSAADLPQCPPSTTTMDLEPVVPEADAPKTLVEWAVLILNTSNPVLKVARTRHAVHLYRTGKIKSVGQNSKNAPKPPDTPPRDGTAQSVDPGKTGRRGKGGSVKSRISMLHALANIEQWAWDIIARHGQAYPYMPTAFFSDFARVALDESKHFSLLSARLEQMGSHYGALSVHAGLWDSAWETRDSLLARLAIIHLVHEARGLDVNPVTIAKFKNAGDDESARVLNIIHSDEITHVTAGHRWFTWLCARGGEHPAPNAQPLDPVATFRSNVQRHFAGALKGPFNVTDRAQAGLSTEFYENLTGHWGEKDFAEPADSSQPKAVLVPLAFAGEKEKALELIEEAGEAKAIVSYEA
ncbi:DUF455-domain-containing protein [Exidia glandulosa HHB12029]|uniref:DUF455-domain-containing protein n=1 Tax=Exidia glandulosa HHB12029 TaxID=1314781 RepID=A0A165Q9Z0_EXIGL|nr:DUF455-domain-containing protein [Exidia glandulosa HHB12029]